MGMCKGCNVVYSALEMKDGYCKNCREAVENSNDNKICEQCGAVNKLNSNFCKKCGNNLHNKSKKLSKSICLETMNGISTKIIKKGELIPNSVSQIFSTAEDNQPAVTISICRGEKEIFDDNEFLDSFELLGISPEPRGVPQIRVQFSIDEKEEIKVSAENIDTNEIIEVIINSRNNNDKNTETKESINIDKIDKNNESKFINKENNNTESNVDELTKWAELLEKGFIDKEDFDKKKKELL